MSDFKDYYKTIPVDIRHTFGSTFKTAEYVYKEQQKQIDKLNKVVEAYKNLHYNDSMPKNDELCHKLDKARAELGESE